MQPALREWRPSSTSSPGFLKSTWRWWLEGRNLGIVREVFEMETREASTVVLKDLGCTTRLRLSSEALHMQRAEGEAWILVSQGSWAGPACQRWDSAAGQEFEAHFETRAAWNGPGKEWWVDGAGDFSELARIHRQVCLDAELGALELEDSRGRVTRVNQRNASTLGTQHPGSWAVQPHSKWLQEAISAEEQEAREPLQKLYLQLEAQDQEYSEATRRAVGLIMSAMDKQAAEGLVKRLGRELARFQARLPAYAHRSHILRAVARHQVVILIGATGSGKSTQILPLLADGDLVPDGLKMVCTQPRKVAAQSLANFVASEWGCAVGEDVGFIVGGQRKIGRSTRMVYATDKSLLNLMVKDEMLLDYGCVVVDEAHERSIDTDLLLGKLKAVCAARPDFRLIVASATIEPELFMQHFGITQEDAAVRIPGRTFPISHVYMERPADLAKRAVHHAVCKTQELLAQPGEGDILVFLPTPDDVMEAVKALQNVSQTDDSVLVLPLHGHSPRTSQNRGYNSGVVHLRPADPQHAREA